MTRPVAPDTTRVGGSTPDRAGVPGVVQRSRSGKLELLVAQLPGQARQWLADLYRACPVDVDRLGSTEWRRLKAFVRALGAIGEVQLPPVRDERAMGAFVYAVLDIAQRLGRLPPGYSTGVEVVALDPDWIDDSLKTVAGIRRFDPSLLRQRPARRARHLAGRHDQAYVRPSDLLRTLSNQLDDVAKPTRMAAQKLIRGSDKEYRGTQGLIYSPFISQNRDAVRRLALSTADADLIVSLERGGSYVADQIDAMLIALGRRTVPHLRVPKPSRGELEAIHDQYHRDRDARDYERFKINRRAEIAREAPDAGLLHRHRALEEFGKKTSHVLKLLRTIQAQVKAAPNRQLNVVVTETVVGGGSTNGLIQGLGYLLRRYNNLRVRLLLHRHTSHQALPENVRVDRDLDLAGPFPNIPLASGGQSLRLANLAGEIADDIGEMLAILKRAIARPAPVPLPGRPGQPWAHPLGLRMASGFYVLGEDIDVFLSGTRTHGEGAEQTTSTARVPIVIFRDNRGVIFRPGMMMNSRRLLQMIVAGAFDGLIERFGIRIADQPDPSTMAVAHRRGFGP